MSDRIKLLRDNKAALIAEADTLLEKSDTEAGLTEDEQARLAKITDDGGELTDVNAKIALAERLMDEKRAMAPSATLGENEDTPAEASDRKPEPRPKDDKRFATFGEQLVAVAHAGMNKGGDRDPRLIWGAPTGAGEAVPSEGGFLVQQDFSTALLDLMHDLGEIWRRLRNVPLSANSNGIKLPMVDETSRADGSRFGGVRAYWADEAATVTSTQPKFRELELSLKKLFGLAYATDELLADAVALESILSTAFAEEMLFKVEDGVVNGTGAGQLLGIINSGALISVAKESGQAAATVVTANILKMWARMPMRSRRRAVWLINQDIEPQLHQLTVGTGAGAFLLYRPPGAEGVAASPMGTMLSRPVVPVEYCATLGTVGDIILFDPENYLVIDKGGVSTAQSMHVRFINDEMTFRWIYRVDGQPAWNSAVTPFKGTNTVSPYVALATRA